MDVLSLLIMILVSCSVLEAALTEEEKKMIREIVSKELISRLKDIYAISTRSRVGRSIQLWPFE